MVLITGLVWFLAVTCAISITLYGKVGKNIVGVKD